MPKPLDGLVVVAEFGTIFEGQVAVEALRQAGMAAIVSHDPAINSVATFYASERFVEVVVRAQDALRAKQVLSVRPGDLPEAFTSAEVETWSRGRAVGGRGHAWARGVVLVASAAALLLLVALSISTRPW